MQEREAHTIDAPKPWNPERPLEGITTAYPTLWLVAVGVDPSMASELLGIKRATFRIHKSAETKKLGQPSTVHAIVTLIESGEFDVEKIRATFVFENFRTLSSKEREALALASDPDNWDKSYFQISQENKDAGVDMKSSMNRINGKLGFVGAGSVERVKLFGHLLPSEIREAPLFVQREVAVYERGDKKERIAQALTTLKNPGYTIDQLLEMEEEGDSVLEKVMAGFNPDIYVSFSPREEAVFDVVTSAEHIRKNASELAEIVDMDKRDFQGALLQVKMKLGVNNLLAVKMYGRKLNRGIGEAA